MTQEQIIEGNKLIADFMNYPKEGEGSAYYYAMKHCYENNNMKYHTSWDWLMPVVEKIHAETDVWVTIMYNCCKMHWMTIGVHEPIMIDEVPTVEAVYTAILQFITWYNQQPK